MLLVRLASSSAWKYNSSKEKAWHGVVINDTTWICFLDNSKEQISLLGSLSALYIVLAFLYISQLHTECVPPCTACVSVNAWRSYSRLSDSFFVHAFLIKCLLLQHVPFLLIIQCLSKRAICNVTLHFSKIACRSWNWHWWNNKHTLDCILSFIGLL